MKTPTKRRMQLYALGTPLLLASAWMVTASVLQSRQPLPTATVPSGTPADADMATIPDGKVPSLLSQRALASPRALFSSPENRAGLSKEIRVASFQIDRHEVTNAQFDEFVIATGYFTTAEQIGTGFVFSPSEKTWVATRDADWRHPTGTNSSIAGKEEFPVVQVSFHDARAFARWSNKQLPNESQWRLALRRRGETVGEANTFQGWYPLKNTAEDGYESTSPVGAYAANGYGVYDMIGNVREWCRPEPSASGSLSHASAVRRGGCWLTFVTGDKLFGVRDSGPPEWRDNTTGFRCVSVR